MHCLNKPCNNQQSILNLCIAEDIGYLDLDLDKYAGHNLCFMKVTHVFLDIE